MLHVFFGNPAMATAYTLEGPSSGLVNVESTDFTVTPDGPADGITVTPATDGTGTFDPTSVTFTDDDPETFTFTPTSAGTHTISVTNDGDLDDPVDLEYEVAAVGGIAYHYENGLGGGFSSLYWD